MTVGKTVPLARLVVSFPGCTDRLKDVYHTRRVDRTAETATDRAMLSRDDSATHPVDALTIGELRAPDGDPTAHDANIKTNVPWPSRIAYAGFELHGQGKGVNAASDKVLPQSENSANWTGRCVRPVHLPAKRCPGSALASEPSPPDWHRRTPETVTTSPSLLVVAALVGPGSITRESTWISDVLNGQSGHPTTSAHLSSRSQMPNGPVYPERVGHHGRSETWYAWLGADAPRCHSHKVDVAGKGRQDAFRYVGVGDRRALGKRVSTIR